MKKYVILLGILCLLLVMCSCSFSKKFPSEGVYYCEALNLFIDTSEVHNQSMCAQLYTDTDSYFNCLCLLDYGNGITITSEDQEKVYLCGTFHYMEKDVFIVIEHSSGKEYTFEKQRADTVGVKP